MRIKHKYLEVVRETPEAVSQILKENKGGGKSMIRYWDYAVGHFHQDNLGFALDYLKQGLQEFKDHKKNRDHASELIGKLERYALNYSKLGFEYVGSNRQLKIDIKHNNLITGEIFRIDKTPEGGYAITVMNRRDEIWAHELRYQLIQIHYSNVFKCPFDIIKVGVYNFMAEDHEYTCYDEPDLKSALDEIEQLSNRINRIVL